MPKLQRSTLQKINEKRKTHLSAILRVPIDENKGKYLSLGRQREKMRRQSNTILRLGVIISSCRTNEI